MVEPNDELFRTAVAAVAPGTELRDGLERILRGRTGALIVLGWNDTVEELCTGGFVIDAPFSATRLRELAKMDGAIVCDGEATMLHRAAAHLVPDPQIATEESGTRHRTAQRVARQTGVPVVSVSQSMQIVSVYLNGWRHVVEASDVILGKADQALATLERYRARLDEVISNLSALEIEDLVTVRDVAAVVQRVEMVRRIAAEIAGYRVQLGTDGRLLALQLEELIGGSPPTPDLLLRDYRSGFEPEQIIDELRALDAGQLIDLVQIARVLGLANTTDEMDNQVSPMGYRLLHSIPRLPPAIVDRLVEQFGGLQALLAAGIEDLQRVEGVGDLRARAVREGLSRLAETSFLERF